MNRLGEILAERGIKQSSLAREVGAHPSLVSKWCSGDQAISERLLPVVAAALGLTVGKLSDSLMSRPARTTKPAVHVLHAVCSECERPRRLLGPTKRCRSCITSQMWRSGAFANVSAHRGDRWLPEEDDLIRHMAGKFSSKEIAAEFERIGFKRSEGAIQFHARLIDVSLWSEAWTLNRVAHLFATSYKTISIAWIESGLLPSKRVHGRGRHPVCRIEERDIEHLIRTCPWEFNATRMQPASHRLAVLARNIQARDPWLTLPEVAQRLRLTVSWTRRWCERGVIPTKRRHVNVHGGSPGVFVVRSSDLIGMREIIDGHIRMQEQRRNELIHAANRRWREQRQAAA